MVTVAFDLVATYTPQFGGTSPSTLVTIKSEMVGHHAGWNGQRKIAGRRSNLRGAVIGGTGDCAGAGDGVWNLIAQTHQRRPRNGGGCRSAAIVPLLAPNE